MNPFRFTVNKNRFTLKNFYLAGDLTILRNSVYFSAIFEAHHLLHEFSIGTSLLHATRVKVALPGYIRYAYK